MRCSRRNFTNTTARYLNLNIADNDNAAPFYNMTNLPLIMGMSPTFTLKLQHLRHDARIIFKQDLKKTKRSFLFHTPYKACNTININKKYRL